MATPDEVRIAELEDKLKEAERRMAELRQERDEARDLAQRISDHVESCNDMIESWKDAFDMSLNADGVWEWRSSFVEGEDWYLKYKALLNDWNRFVPDYNARVAPKNVGRPLEASEAQCKEVRRLRKSGNSLRCIADKTSLSLNTVRTILGKEAGTDRATRKVLERVMPDRLAEASWKRKAKTRNALPKRINHSIRTGAALRKEAKGLA
jgi:hypothetical protein